MPKPALQWWRQGQDSTKLLPLENKYPFLTLSSLVSPCWWMEKATECVFFVVQIDKKATLLGQTLFWFSRIVVGILEPQVTDSTVLICSKSWACCTDLVNGTEQTQIIPRVYVGCCLSFRCFNLRVFISFNMVSKGLQFKGKKRLSISS